MSFINLSPHRTVKLCNPISRLYKNQRKQAASPATEVWLRGLVAPLIHANQHEGQNASQSDSEAHSAPSVLLLSIWEFTPGYADKARSVAACLCVCVCECRVKMPRAAERDAASRRSEGEAKENGRVSQSGSHNRREEREQFKGRTAFTHSPSEPTRRYDGQTSPADVRLFYRGEMQKQNIDGFLRQNVR